MKDANIDKAGYALLPNTYRQVFRRGELVLAAELRQDDSTERLQARVKRDACVGSRLYGGLLPDNDELEKAREAGSLQGGKVEGIFDAGMRLAWVDQAEDLQVRGERLDEEHDVPEVPLRLLLRLRVLVLGPRLSFEPRARRRLLFPRGRQAKLANPRFRLWCALAFGGVASEELNDLRRLARDQRDGVEAHRPGRCTEVFRGT